MKNFTLAFGLFFWSFLAFGQAEKKDGHSFSVSYNWMASSENLGFVWQRDFGKNEVGGGLRWHLNRIPTNENRTHRSARNFRQHLGGIISYKRKFRIGQTAPQFFAFAEGQFFSTGIWHYYYGQTDQINTSPNGNGKPLFILQSYIDPKPVFCMEPVLGLGGEFAITKRLNLSLRAGTGVLLANDPGLIFPNVKFLGVKWDCGLTAMLSGGFVYRLGK